MKKSVRIVTSSIGSWPQCGKSTLKKAKIYLTKAALTLYFGAALLKLKMSKILEEKPEKGWVLLWIRSFIIYNSKIDCNCLALKVYFQTILYMTIYLEIDIFYAKILHCASLHCWWTDQVKWWDGLSLLVYLEIARRAKVRPSFK